jgi:hypothetical protein
MVKDVKRLLHSCSLLPLEHNDLRNTCLLISLSSGIIIVLTTLESKQNQHKTK